MAEINVANRTVVSPFEPEGRCQESLRDWLCPKIPLLTRNQHFWPKIAETAKLGLLPAFVRHQPHLN